MTDSNYSHQLESEKLSFSAFPYSIRGNTNAWYDNITLLTCVLNAVSAPVAGARNALVLAATWKNPAFRTPAYILLAGLALTDFGTGLVTRPFYAMDRLVKGTNSKLFCFSNRIANIVGPYFASITAFTITLMSVERWLHISRRSFSDFAPHCYFVLHFSFSSRSVRCPSFAAFVVQFYNFLC